MKIDTERLERGCFYGVGTDGVFYKVTPRMVMPVAKTINVQTGEVHYPTNYDRIRAKSIEELAELLSVGCPYRECGKSLEELDSATCCMDCWLGWLKQEVEE